MFSNLTFKGKLAYIWRIFLFKSNVLNFFEQLSSTFLDFGESFEKRFKKIRATRGVIYIVS